MIVKISESVLNTHPAEALVRIWEFRKISHGIFMVSKIVKGKAYDKIFGIRADHSQRRDPFYVNKGEYIVIPEDWELLMDWSNEEPL